MSSATARSAVTHRLCEALLGAQLAGYRRRREEGLRQEEVAERILAHAESAQTSGRFRCDWPAELDGCPDRVR